MKSRCPSNVQIYSPFPHVKMVNSTKSMPRELPTQACYLWRHVWVRCIAAGRADAGSMEKNSALLRESRESLGSRQFPPTTAGSEPARRARAAERFARRCCHGDKSGSGQPCRAIDRCWAHPQRAAGRGAAPPQQIRRDDAAAPGRPPTELWLPSRGRAQASRRSCGRRRLRRRMPHR